MADLTLYTYFRSSAAYRVRIALQLKGLDARMVPVNLLQGEHLAESFDETNPQHLIPVLEDEHLKVSQSLAILEYLDESYPAPPLMPAIPAERARVRSLCQLIACDVHPLNTPRVMKLLAAEFGATDEQKTAWMHRWMSEGFAAMEAMLQDEATGGFCHGDAPTLADCCLVPQVYNAQRYGMPMDAYPTIRRIHAHCMEYTPFQAARPERQFDTPPDLRG